MRRASLVRSYLDAYGPATPQQFAQWLPAPRRWATQLPCVRRPPATPPSLTRARVAPVDGVT
ncbi:DNA glycosylase AlkZ-like family protein [Micromonospora chersina]|uniref:DNA glycosylase AlkZ-like family protein n=1 Tax=Micromonospora chersina TaxID=47854 RepID=UPI0037200E83